MATRSTKIEVLLVAIDANDEYKKLVERVGGDNVNVKVVKTVDHVYLEHLLLLASYDLKILMVTVEDGIKVTRDLRESYYVKSMIVGVIDTEEERDELITAGVNECAVMPLTDEKMELVFNNLKTGMENRSIVKHFFKALIVNDDADDAFRRHHEKLCREAGGLVSMSVFTLTNVQLGIPYDIILMTDAAKVKELREKGLNTMMVGVTLEAEQLSAFVANGVTDIFPAPLTMEKLRPLINRFNIY